MIPMLVVPIDIPNVPFYSQFQDIQSVKWQKQGCGVASLAMVIDFYKPKAVTVNTLLGQAITAGAYDQAAGWTHKGLVQLAESYGLKGHSYDLTGSDSKTAFSQFREYLKDGPVIVSVHYKFDPKSTIPHLVVIDGVDKDIIYYNDPASKSGQKQISTADFLKGWKQKFIVIRPSHAIVAVATSSESGVAGTKVSIAEVLENWVREFAGVVTV